MLLGAEQHLELVDLSLIQHRPVALHGRREVLLRAVADIVRVLEEPWVLDGGRAVPVQHAAPQELLPRDGLAVCGIEHGIPESAHCGIATDTHTLVVRPAHGAKQVSQELAVALTARVQLYLARVPPISRSAFLSAACICGYLSSPRLLTST